MIALLLIVAVLLAPRTPQQADEQSIGLPRAGRLQNATELEHVGKNHVVMEYIRVTKRNYGTDYLVDTVLRMTDDLRRGTDLPKFQIGQLSLEHGGKSPVSASHQSGRDVDIPIPALDARGVPNARRYCRFYGPEGKASPSQPNCAGFRMDVRTTRRMVQWLFTNRVIELIVLDPDLTELVIVDCLADAECRPLEGIIRERTKMVSYAKPHNNHMHVRVSCSDDDSRCREE